MARGLLLGDGVGMGAQVMLKEVFMPFSTGANGVAAPDEPNPRPILRRIRILDPKFQFFSAQLLYHIPDDLRVRLSASRQGFLHQA